eukprot:3465720-Amphidinium_carterae.1
MFVLAAYVISSLSGRDKSTLQERRSDSECSRHVLKQRFGAAAVKKFVELQEMQPGMRNLSVRAKVAFISMPHRSKSGSAMLLVELYEHSLDERNQPPMKLTVLDE